MTLLTIVALFAAPVAFCGGLLALSNLLDRIAKETRNE